jgi:predicted nucleic acid-binding protein
VTRAVLLDTGPLVALLDRRDRYHSWMVEHWADVEVPLLTCEAVLSEACFRMVERHPAATVLTLDRDFRVYRAHGRRVIPVLMPSDL